jgi:hypothetical protein
MRVFAVRIRAAAKAPDAVLAGDLTTAELMQAREVRFGFGLGTTRPAVSAMRSGR